MKLDLSTFANAIASLEEGIAVVRDESWYKSQSEAVRNTLIAGVIQNFEFVYELGIKMIRRRIDLDAASPTEADFADFRELLRMAGERGLVKDVGKWFEYRKLRNITTHTYDHAKARQVYKGALTFVRDARDLLEALEARNG